MWKPYNEPKKTSEKLLLIPSERRTKKQGAMVREQVENNQELLEIKHNGWNKSVNRSFAR